MTELEKEIEFLESPVAQLYPAMVHVRLPINDRVANGDNVVRTFKDAMWELIKEKENAR